MKQQQGINLVRLYAIAAVPAVHFFLNTDFYSTPLNGPNMFLQTFLRSIFLICVPLFLIITGYLQGNKEPNRAYFKKLTPIISAYIIYSICAILFRDLYLDEHRTITEWLTLFFSFEADGYAWYVNMYIGLFLLVPYLNLIYKGLLSKKAKLLFISILIFLTGIPEFLNHKLDGILYFPDYWKIIYPIMYFYIGCFIREFQPKINKVFYSSVFILLAIFSAALEFHYAAGETFGMVTGYYSSVVVMTMAIIMFLILYNVDIKKTAIAAALTIFSSLSLEIYLGSYIADQFIYPLLTEGKTQQVVLYSFIICVSFSLISSFVLAFIIRTSQAKILSVFNLTLKLSAKRPV